MKTPISELLAVCILAGGLVGCAGGQGLTNLSGFSNEALDKYVAPVPKGRLDLELIRAKLIVTVLAHYGADVAKQYGGQRKAGDADRILGRLINVRDRMKLAEAVLLKAQNAQIMHRFFPNFRRVQYASLILELSLSAIEPAKRHYRSLILPFFTSSPELSALVIVKTVIGAIKRAGKIEIYRQALKKDFATFIKKAEVNNPVSQDDLDAIEGLMNEACIKLAKRAGRIDPAKACA